MLCSCAGVSNKRYPLNIPDSKKNLEIVGSSENLLTWAVDTPSSEDFLKEKQYFSTLKNIPLGIPLKSFNKIITDFNFGEKRYIERKNNSEHLGAADRAEISNIQTKSHPAPKGSWSSDPNINICKTKQLVSEYDFSSKFRICPLFQNDIVNIHDFRITKFIIIDHIYFENKLISLSIGGPYYIISPVDDKFSCRASFKKYFFGEVPNQSEEIMKKIPEQFGLLYWGSWSPYRLRSESDIKNALNEISKFELKDLIGQKYADRVRFRVDFKPRKMTNEDILNLKNN
jgi:hypothetical protein